ncbi:MAM and LDL-receptor class A domain-containing protein 2-like [Lutzomyia longipalpis]|uniref:MAM and LDL-receptor class A domain-containing protein 2-like n=1 Tax=Lutzomyia longipalpis TaxID=7200 RepID=UPI0024833353|nr:MAM and LDL-receptor class A domain-containing protein 2-like [Lutzomyia longipalpis]
MLLHFVFILLSCSSIVCGITRAPLRGRPPFRGALRNIPTCETPYIRHGSIVRRQRGRTVEYVCDPTFTLAGNRFAVCSGGRWDVPVPFCIKPGCKMPKGPTNGAIVAGDTTASALLFCLPNYEVAGAREAFCDGEEWDRPLGTCRETRVGPQVACDFESATICGWTNDDSHDINWVRSSGVQWAPHRPPRAGPRHDHTIGKPLEGHFMMVDSLRHVRHGQARLLSPIYNATYSRGCFRFHFNMYGASVGSLVLYQKPLSVPIEEVRLSRDSLRLFSASGNQGNAWHVHEVQLEAVQEPFQLFFEAQMSSSSTDIALDDVELDLGCGAPTENPETTTEESGGVYQMDSCRDRCSENTTVATNGSFVKEQEDDGLSFRCDCHGECLELRTCCPDYLEICIGNPEGVSAIPEIRESSHVAFLAIGGAATSGALCLGLLVWILCRRSAKKSVNYADVMYDRKKRARKIEKGQEADDSDIKCLTADEELDFTLMTPQQGD